MLQLFILSHKQLIIIVANTYKYLTYIFALLLAQERMAFKIVLIIFFSFALLKHMPS